jgi:hypothetical protein
MNECLRLCGETRFLTPARFASRLTITISGVTVHTAAFRADEDRTRRPFPDVQVQAPAGSRCEWDRDLLAVLADDPQCPMAAVHVESAFNASLIRSPFNARSGTNHIDPTGHCEYLAHLLGPMPSGCSRLSRLQRARSPVPQ